MYNYSFDRDNWIGYVFVLVLIIMCRLGGISSRDFYNPIGKSIFDCKWWNWQLRMVDSQIQRIFFVVLNFQIYEWLSIICMWKSFNTLRPRQNGRHFPDDIFKWIFLNENVWISINISLKFVPRGPINNIPTLVQVMAWRRPGDKSLSEPMMVRLPTHICVTRPQWVNWILQHMLTYLYT